MDLDGAYAGAVQLLRDWVVAPAAAASNAVRGGGRDEEDGSRQTSGSEAAAPAAPKADGRRSSRGMVIYGSQKGNAKRLAHQLARGLRPFGVRLDVVDAADCEVERLRDARLVLVVISTYTEGSPPEPARWFCRSLGEAAHDFRFGADYLKGLTFAAFGCGNSQYGLESFNRCARDVCEHMRLMGANEAVPMHEGDEDLPASLDDQMAEWIPEVGPAVVGAAGPRHIVGSAPKKRAQAQDPAAAGATVADDAALEAAAGAAGTTLLCRLAQAQQCVQKQGLDYGVEGDKIAYICNGYAEDKERNSSTLRTAQPLRHR